MKQTNALRSERKDGYMLNVVMKSGDKLQIGDHVVIKLQSDSRAQLAIDAPKEVSIRRIAADIQEKQKEQIR